MPPRRNLKPRRRTQDANNIKHIAFARHYLDCLDAGEAYRRAGYTVATEESAQACGRRLLRDVRVQGIIDSAKLKMAEEAATTAANTVARFNLVYLEAMARKDFTAALGALKELGKYHGIYLEHNKQRHYKEEDVERLKKELEEKGFSFARVNDRSAN